MSATAIVIGEILAGIIQIVALRAQAAGLSAEETDRMIDEAIAKAKATKPEDLPDV